MGPKKIVGGVSKKIVGMGVQQFFFAPDGAQPWTHKRTHGRTDGHGDSMTESADSVKIKARRSFSANI